METLAPLCYCVSSCQTPLHYLFGAVKPALARSLAPSLHHHHHMANFIASICFCFLDFPSESMFTAWVDVFYVLRTSTDTPLLFILLFLFLHPAPGAMGSVRSTLLSVQFGFTSQSLSPNNMERGHVCTPAGPLTPLLCTSSSWSQHMLAFAVCNHRVSHALRNEQEIQSGIKTGCCSKC